MDISIYDKFVCLLCESYEGYKISKDTDTIYLCENCIRDIANMYIDKSILELKKGK